MEVPHMGEFTPVPAGSSRLTLNAHLCLATLTRTEVLVPSLHMQKLLLQSSKHGTKGPKCKTPVGHFGTSG